MPGLILINLPPTPKLTLLGWVSSRQLLFKANTSIGGAGCTQANLDIILNLNNKTYKSLIHGWSQGAKPIANARLLLLNEIDDMK